MKKRTALISLVLTAILSVVILFFTATYKIYGLNGFNRSAIIPILKHEKTLLIREKKLLNYCGKSLSSYYFATTQVGTLLQTDLQLGKPRIIVIKLPDSLFGSINVKTYVDYPRVNIYFGNKGVVIHANLLKDSLYESRIPFNFTRVVEMSDRYKLFRGFDKQKRNKVLFKNDLLKGTIVASYKEGDFNDGGLMSDGLLNYDQTTGLVIYTHYHNNISIILDSNLRFLTSYHTIDTFAHFQTSAIKTPHGFSYNKPKRSLIRHAYTFKGKLFILSLIKADNQNESDYRLNSTIDVYNLKNGRYITTFYIPILNAAAPSNFFIDEHSIITVSQHYITSYNMPHTIIED